MKTLLFLFLSIANCWSQTIPEAPSVTENKIFWTTIAIDGASTGLDAYTTVAFIGPGQKCLSEGGNPELYGYHPAPTRTALVMAALFVSSTLFSYELKKHHVKIFHIPTWPLPTSYEAYSHSRGAVSNFRHCR